MKITGWTHPDNSKYKDFFCEDFSNEECDIAEELVVEKVRSNGYKFNGRAHQGEYCPVIDDKYFYMVSMRRWGAIMQKAYNLPNGDGLGYVRWAWCTPEGQKPKYPNTEETGE